MLKRFAEQKLKSRLAAFPAVAILGARQVGKTTLAKKIAALGKQKTVYLDLENPRDINKLQGDGYSYLESLEHLCVILDEVQRMPGLFSWLRPLIDARRTKGRFLLLGSAGPGLVRGISESLAGRISYLELSPLTLTELKGERITQDRHWFIGGFPKILTTRNTDTALQAMDDLITSYVERDLSSLFGVALSPRTMRNFLTMIASRNGGIWNASDFARSLGISVPTVTRYLHFLEGAFLINILPAWFVNTTKRIVRAPRVYIADSGMLHRLCQLPRMEDLPGHIVAGSSWEGYAIQQIIKSKPEGIQAYYYRTQNGAECDLVLVRGLRPVSTIEIKLSNSPVPARGYFNCIDDLKTKRNFIITPASTNYPYQSGVAVTSLKTFLTDSLTAL